MRTTIIITLLLIFTIPGIRGAEAAEADSAYTAGNYAQAVALYSEIAETHGTSAGLLFNLGNAYYQTGSLGKAMLYWQRAHRLAPSASEINANIKYLSEKVEDANKAEQKGKRLQVQADKPSFFQTMHRSIASDTSSDTWALWAAICFIGFTGCAAVYMFCANVPARKGGFFGGIVLGSISIVLLCFAFMGASESTDNERAVVTGYKCILLTEPGKQDANAKGPVLTQGTLVRVVSEESDAEGTLTWIKVRLNSDYIGWLPASEVAVI